MVSGTTASSLDTISKNRISFRMDLNDTRHCDDNFSGDDGFSDDGLSDIDDDDDDETSPSKDPETAEIASMERSALKYRKSLTLLNQIAGLSLTNANGGSGGDAGTGANGAKQPTKEHLLAAKKSIDDLTAWVNAGALEGDDDPFSGDDD
ncbi:hypothetical protein BGZ95_010123 [Linnemannia exigua]|uniref:Uncharacterized protein n=1 Tax=Linnemannia exigua TaxID=604196 RepID=A0AAD4DBU9_9FUNG|nr:hypothetical protein BGZ95_010123 [Linnemannia exigua]